MVRQSNHHNDSEFIPRVAVYARFSCDKQRDASIEDQLYEAERHCERQGYKIVKVYTDYAMSGRSDDRPQFLAMIADAETGAFDIVLVWKMDRFARNMQDQYYYEKLINDAGVRLESVKENISGNGIEASMSKGMHAIFAQIRSQQSAEDTMRGMIGKARRCQYLGYQWLGYTHDGDVITLDPATMPIARGIHDKYLAGHPIKEIVEWINSQGITNRNGKAVGYQYVTGILKNWAYAGVYTWGKAKDEQGRELIDADGLPVPLVRIEDGIPAIVTVDEKEACLRRLRYRKHANAKTDFRLSGKLYCKECGNPMHGEGCIDRYGEKRFRYCCQARRKACTGVYWKDAIEDAVAQGVQKMLRDREALERIIEEFDKYRNGKKPEASIEAARADLKSVSKQRDNLVKAVEDGMPFKHVKDKLEKLDAQQERLEKKIADLQRDQAPIPKDELIRFFADLADGFKSDEEILKAFVSQVWVFGDDVFTIMSFNGKFSTPYEIKTAYEKARNTRSVGVSSNLNLVPPTKNKTNDTPVLFTSEGAPVILLESGFGIVVSLKAA